MAQLSNVFASLAKNISTRSGRKSKLQTGMKAANTLVKEAKKNETILTSSGSINAINSKHVTSAYSKRGGKVNNQDRLVVWEEYGCQEDMTFCGIFDGHGPWGHLVAKTLMELMPSFLLRDWQEAIAQCVFNEETDSDGCYCLFDLWKQSYLKTCSDIDHELALLPGIDSFYSGSTALTIVQQGDMLVIANIGDSRAVLATKSKDGSLTAIQLTVDLKPNLPKESQRITESKGRVSSCQDEPGVYRVWMPVGNASGGPGLSISRAFGDHFIKAFGLISEPELTKRKITKDDQFVILATDGVWDVVSNEEAMKIVASTPKKEESAKRLVECAVCAWKLKRPGIAVDDVSAICLFFNSC